MTQGGDFAGGGDEAPREGGVKPASPVGTTSVSASLPQA